MHHHKHLLNSSFKHQHLLHIHAWSPEQAFKWSTDGSIMGVFQNLERCLSRQHIWGQFSKRPHQLCHKSCAGRQLARFQNTAWVFARVCVCVADSAGDATGDVKESRAHIVPQPWPVRSWFERWQRFHGLPVSFKRPTPPPSLSIALPAVALPVSPPKYIRPRDQGAFWLLKLESVYEN